MTDQECHVDQFGRSEVGRGSAVSFVKMRRSTIRPIRVSAVWKVPDDRAQTRIALGRIEYAPLLASCLEGSGVDQDKSRNGGDRALVLPAVGYTAHDNDFTLLHGYDLSAVELDIDLACQHHRIV